MAGTLAILLPFCRGKIGLKMNFMIAMYSNILEFCRDHYKSALWKMAMRR